MRTASHKQYNLPWHQYDHYWISVYPGQGGGSFASPLMNALQQIGMQPVAGNAFTLKAERHWKDAWDKVYAHLDHSGSLGVVDVAVTPGDAPPLTGPPLDRKTPAAIHAIAQSLWLGDALLEDRIMCYLQPVVSGRDKVVGYESFARVKGTDGSIIGGDRIMAASKALGIEYMIDRHLHVEAIMTFVLSNFSGFLFVNLSPGFIHRPAVYLEGLSETAKNLGIIAKHIVLDFTKSETPRDITHLKSVCEYARSRGYSIALDDIESLDGARKLLPDIHPDFVKIGMTLARQCGEPRAKETIRLIAELVHNNGGTVIGEGVETEEMHQNLKALGVDLFQGYLFSPPVPVETVLQKSAAGG